MSNDKPEAATAPDLEVERAITREVIQAMTAIMTSIADKAADGPAVATKLLAQLPADFVDQARLLLHADAADAAAERMAELLGRDSRRAAEQASRADLLRGLYDAARDWAAWCEDPDEPPGDPDLTETEQALYDAVTAATMSGLFNSSDDTAKQQAEQAAELYELHVKIGQYSAEVERLNRVIAGYEREKHE